LDVALPIQTLETVREVRTDNGDTIKTLTRTEDGHFVETVLMLYRDRATVCVSCQVGCAVGCTFCATGIGGLARNLTAGEMVEQTVSAVRQARGLGRPLTNLVMMGMGEPLQNYAETMAFVAIINDPKLLGFGARRITISTSGIVPRIDALAEEPYQVNLAVSLHAPNDELRDQLVPINRRWPVETLLAAVDRYTAKTGRRVSFEYALMGGINDSDETAHELGALLRGRLCHLNVIPYNPVELLDFHRPSPERIDRFAEIVGEYGVPVTVRYSRGVEIAAACGQLRHKHEAAATA
jgi:23S rRNA (adenine2503-C2)-methyltransferase